tara:strand:- start:98 stop:313 length:216 start_codon:yes stop_codon:yes gene_type:complete
MKELMITYMLIYFIGVGVILYINISGLAIDKTSLSQCCGSSYRYMAKDTKQRPYCLTCKKWCEVIETKEAR